jgi:hypothetical protein
MCVTKDEMDNGHLLSIKYVKNASDPIWDPDYRLFCGNPGLRRMSRGNDPVHHG